MWHLLTRLLQSPLLVSMCAVCKCVNVSNLCLFDFKFVLDFVCWFGLIVYLFYWLFVCLYAFINASIIGQIYIFISLLSWQRIHKCSHVHVKHQNIWYCCLSPPKESTYRHITWQWPCHELKTATDAIAPQGFSGTNREIISWIM